MSNLQKELQEAIENGYATIVSETPAGPEIIEFDDPKNHKTSPTRVPYAELRWRKEAGLYREEDEKTYILPGTRWYFATRPEAINAGTPEGKETIRQAKLTLLNLNVEKLMAGQEPRNGLWLDAQRLPKHEQRPFLKTVLAHKLGIDLKEGD